MLTQISKRIAFTALIATMAVSAGTSSAFAGSRTAARACAMDIDSDYHPVRILDISPDGLGDYDVVLRDVDGDIWHCNAGPDGYIYQNDFR